MLTAIVVDDDPIALEKMSHFLKQSNLIQLQGATSNPKDGLNYITSRKPDVAILDVDMPELDGIQLAEKLNQSDHQTHIIFTTSHANYIRDAFRVYAYDFIEKPVDFDRLKQSLLRLDEKLYPDGECVTVHTEDGERFLYLNDIVVCEARGKTAFIYTHEDSFDTKESFKELSELLVAPYLFKVSRSAIVNLHFVKGIEKYNRTSFDIELDHPEAQALLSKSHYDDFKLKIKSYYRKDQP